MVALDMLGRRGALRLLWELRGEPLTFRALQTACDTNPGSLNTRLKELRELGIVDHDAGGYRLTEVGRSLIAALQPLQTWADRVGERSVRSRLSLNMRFTSAIGGSRQPSWAATPAATKAATIAANPTPFIPPG